MDNINEKIQKFVKKQIKKTKKSVPVPESKTHDELLSILKRVGGDSRITEKRYNELKEKDDPISLTFHRRFGCWNTPCEMVWGRDPNLKGSFLKDQCDETYLVTLINEYKIKDKSAYLEKRKKYPELFPSVSMIIKMFKNFGNLILAAEKFSLNEQLMKCLAIRIELGRCPTLIDYKDRGVNVDLLLRKYVTQREINKMVRLLEEGYEKSRRNSEQALESNGKVSEREKKKVFTSFPEQLHK